VVVGGEGFRTNVFDAVLLAPFLAVVVTDKTYSSFALPWLETKEAGREGPGIWNLNGILRTRLARPGLRVYAQSRESTANSQLVPSIYCQRVRGVNDTTKVCQLAIWSLPRFHNGIVDLRNSGC
jgi:hypothetical protein